MAIYSKENITKITKISHHEFPLLVQNLEKYLREIYDVYSSSSMCSSMILAMISLGTGGFELILSIFKKNAAFSLQTSKTLSNLIRIALKGRMRVSNE